LTRSVRVYALVRGASAFLSALVRRPPVQDAPRATRSPEPAVTATPQAGVENRCPVCQARFRGARICSRCGADLEPLMVLAVKAWQWRQAARQALGAGDVERALGLAIEAQGIQETESGGALRLLGAWLRCCPAPRRAAGCQSDHHCGDRGRNPVGRPGQRRPNRDGELPTLKIDNQGFEES
jgi:hypothetical protein